MSRPVSEQDKTETVLLKDGTATCRSFRRDGSFFIQRRQNHGIYVKAAGRTTAIMTEYTNTIQPTGGNP